MFNRSSTKLLIAICVLMMMASLVQAGWIHLKAQLAQQLLDNAWQESLQTGGNSKPWQWSDSWPVASLSFPSRGINQIILNSDDGSALAFAPGHMQGTAMPGRQGIAVISAHRDTHFTFLKDLGIGDRLVVTRKDGREVPYRVNALQVVDTRKPGMKLISEQSQLVLLTCYPFDAVFSGTPYRYVVTANAVTTPVLTRM